MRAELPEELRPLIRNIQFLAGQGALGGAAEIIRVRAAQLGSPRDPDLPIAAAVARILAPGGGAGLPGRCAAAGALLAAEIDRLAAGKPARP